MNRPEWLQAENPREVVLSGGWANKPHRYLYDAVGVIEKQDAELAELRLTLAAELGQPEGALPGWVRKWGQWHLLDADKHTVAVVRLDGGWWECLILHGSPAAFARVDLAIEGMRAVTEALANAGR